MCAWALTSRDFIAQEPVELNSNPADAEFHFHPHYRSQRPLDATLLKVNAALDDFVTEKYHDQIAASLKQWSSSLLQSPHAVQALQKLLAPQFSGSSLNPVKSRVVRSGPVLEEQQIEFSQQPSIDAAAFLRQIGAFVSRFSKLLTADLQITGIETGSAPASALSSISKLPDRLRTRVRYEFVGTGPGYHREQRVGNWDLVWEPSASGEFRIRSWHAISEARSCSRNPVFGDVTAAALGSNESYSGQLLHGVDYWRTVLDAACGVDVYGHNGISVADIDGDGFDDLYICQPAGLPNRLYRNRGDGTFEDVTESSGLGILENTACALFADFNNDGRQDVIVVRANGPLLFVNQGDGKFQRKPDAFKFAQPPQGTFTGAAVADYDRDGWLDIYFCLYAYYQGTDQYKYPVPYYAAENGPPNFMMRNNRDGTFRDVTRASGLNQNNTRYSFCCAWNDYDGDGWPDLYVVNDFGRKNLYRNHGDGTFIDVAAEAGVEDVGAGMSVCWFDYDNDGADDLYIADMWSAAGERLSSLDVFKPDAAKEIRALYRKHAMGNSLFRNGGVETNRVGSSGSAFGSTFGTTFNDKTISAGTGIGRWAWSSDAWDFDHDGFPDLYIVNGMISAPSREDLNSFFWRQVVANSPDDARFSHDYEQAWNAINELIRSDGTWSGYERNVFYANNRDGTFSDVSGAVELDFIEDGRSFALADFDHDGRQEVFLKNRNAPQLRVLHNVVETLAPAISFRLQGTKSNRDAIGAVVTIKTASGRQARSLQAGSGFLSQSSKDVFFGLGEAKGPVQASIRWPSGLVQELHDLPPLHRIWIEEGSAQLRAEPFNSPFEVQGPNFSPPPPSSRQAEPLPDSLETWLLVPVLAPDFSLPDSSGETRTLAAFRGKPLLLNFFTAQSPLCQRDLKTFNRVSARWASQGLRLLAVSLEDPAPARSLQFPFPVLRGSEDVAAIYNILYRYLFDRHRDLQLPTSFLINEHGEIVKIYQGALNPVNVERDFRQIPRNAGERLAKALPWLGVSDSYEFARNYLTYGSVFFQRGYFEQAESSFRQALRDDPTSAEAYYGVGSACLSVQKTEEARASFRRATELESNYPETIPNAWNNLGLLAARQGQTEEAIGYFQQALKLNPDHLVALENLGNAYRQQKKWDEARKVLEHAVAVSPTDPESNYSLGMVFAQTNDAAQAYEYLQRALKSRPAYPEALNNLAILYLRTQRRDEAVATFEQCIRVAPAFDQSYLNLSRVYALEGAPDKARAVLLELLTRQPDHEQAQKELQELQH